VNPVLPTSPRVFVPADATAEELDLTGHSYAAAVSEGAVVGHIVHAEDRKSWGEQLVLTIFVAVPFLAVLAAIPIVWGWGIGWADIVLGIVFYAIATHGITIGFHRLFTHGAFKAKRGMRIALAVAGSTAIEGSVIQWVADHRKHHAYSDAEGDPHSPWRYGEGWWAVLKGLGYAHVGWLFEMDQSPPARYAPDLLKDKDIVAVSKNFKWIAAASLALPAVLGGLLTWSWLGALTAFFWAGIVRVALVHHTTWSINSICHVWGKKPFKARDRSGNVAWLAILSGGESWHNLHHADPTCARHGVLKGQIDSSARLIELFEYFGWVYDVRWPKADRLEARRVKPESPVSDRAQKQEQQAA